LAAPATGFQRADQLARVGGELEVHPPGHGLPPAPGADGGHLTAHQMDGRGIAADVHRRRDLTHPGIRGRIRPWRAVRTAPTLNVVGAVILPG
jgi:hypothetical protein